MALSDKDTKTIVNGLQIAVTAIQILTPIIEGALQRGEVSIDDQEDAQSVVDAVRSKAAFAAPHWQKPEGESAS